MNDLTFKAAQEQLDSYIKQFKVGYFQPLSQIARLTEELGELSREVMHVYGEKQKKATEPDGAIEEELVDLMISIIIFANSLDIDLAKQFNINMRKFEIRDKDRW